MDHTGDGTANAASAGRRGPSTSPFRGVVLGGASYAGLYRASSEADATAALQAAWDGGIRAFDTAPHYGVGLSEERLGRFLAGKPRGAFAVSTKVGRLLYDDPDARDGTDQFFGVPKRSRRRDYSAVGVRRSLEESLCRLGLDRVDLLLIHDPDEYMAQALTEAAPELARMRDEGVIAGFGVGMNDADLALRFVTETDLDQVMIAGRYTLLDRRGRHLLDACAERGVRVLAAGVFNSGLLADPGSVRLFNYAAAPEPVVRAAVAMHRACERWGVPLRAAALQFPLRHRAVAAVVSGAGTAGSVTDTLRQLRVPVPEDLYAELDGLVPPVEALP